VGGIVDSPSKPLLGSLDTFDCSQSDFSVDVLCQVLVEGRFDNCLMVEDVLELGSA
jgi:hypothetical protein